MIALALADDGGSVRAVPAPVLDFSTGSSLDSNPAWFQPVTSA
jgi:hypothetical protein